MSKPRFILLPLFLGLVLLGGCSQSESNADEKNQGAAMARVSVTTAQHQDVNFIENLPARVQAYRVSEIRPQVGGIIEQVLFNQGSEVNAGQALFKINADIFQADVNSFAANLSKAQAEVKRLKSQLDRYAQLLPSNAISKQDYANTEAAYQQAIAEVAQMRANLTRQNLNLKYATVRAPISGRIGKILVTEGALVNSNDSNAMAVVQQIDKVYVDVKQSVAEYEQLQEHLNSGALQTNALSAVQILNSQGKPYPVTGKILFSDTSVDPDTGDVTIRVLVDNPQRKLLPGMYVRVSLNRASVPNALLLPEQAIQRDVTGQPQITVINQKQQAEIRPIELGQAYQGAYVIRTGLKAGERVVVEGHERILPEQKLQISEWKAKPLAVPVSSTQHQAASAVQAEVKL
ncbi:multidrug efflux system membrane fusion protein [Acinetobacter calcoaceticus]|uniref:Multidrug efflux system membrane fusion protein n=1 Tax=Acinetobacter calcoaceticus TaxID=471 RepID=A0A4R1XWV7_ACICA|nr:multidrug efflux system membrane fusion protein [Acinetobacter calcoaceticus]